MKFDAAKLVVLTRPHFYAGQLITAEDLNAEQEYQRQEQWLHNRMLHGYGIVAGLEALVEQDENGARLLVAPGYALDGWGRELVVPEQLTLGLPGDRRDLMVYLQYVDDADGQSEKSANANNPARAAGSVRLVMEHTPADRAITPTQRSDYAIPLARLQRPHHTWQRDRNFRPPRTHS